MMGRSPIQPPKDGILEPFLFTQLAIWVSVNISGVFSFSPKGEWGQNVSEVPT